MLTNSERLDIFAPKFIPFPKIYITTNFRHFRFFYPTSTGSDVISNQIKYINDDAITKKSLDLKVA